MKITKDRIMFLMLVIIVVIITSSISTYATSYLYNSNEVSYNNNESGITSDNVQGAIDTLYEEATNYNTLDNRISTLEGRWKNGGDVLNVGTSSASNWKEVRLVHQDAVRANFYFNPSGNATYLASNNSSGSTGTGKLDLRGNPVMVNGISMGDLIKVKRINVKCNSLSQNYNLSSLISLDSGYKFLAWQTMGTSNGWISGFPIYVSSPLTTAGGVFWNGTLNTNYSVDFFYFEIKS